MEQSLISRADEQDILRLEIRVRHAVVMQKLYSKAQLISNVTHLIHRIRMELVLLLYSNTDLHLNVPRLIEFM